MTSVSTKEIDELTLAIKAQTEATIMQSKAEFERIEAIKASTIATEKQAEETKKRNELIESLLFEVRNLVLTINKEFKPYVMDHSEKLELLLEIQRILIQNMIRESGSELEVRRLTNILTLLASRANEIKVGTNIDSTRDTNIIGDIANSMRKER